MSNSNTNKISPWPIYLLLVAAYAVVFHFWQFEPVPKGVYGLSILLFALSLVPLAIWYRSGNKGMPIFEGICLSISFAYSVPIYLVPPTLIIRSEEQTILWPDISAAVILTASGVMALMCGFYFSRNLFRAIPLQLDLPITGEQQFKFAGFAIMGGFIFKWLAEHFSNPTFSMILTVLGHQAEIGMILLAYLVYQQRNPPISQRILLYGGVAIGTVLGLCTGMLSNALAPLLFVLIVRWHVRRKFPIVMVLFAGAFLFIFNPAKVEYRDRVWFGDDANDNTIQKLGVWYQAVENSMFSRNQQSSDTTDDSGFEMTMRRIDLLRKFAWVHSMTPSEVPYFEGKTYIGFFYSFVPRILWPEKPSANYATDMVDFSYKFRSPDDPHQNTKIGVGLIAEAYANYGWIGVPIIMAIQGMVFSLLHRILNGPRSVGGRAIYLCVMFAFLNGIGTQAIILFGAIMQTVIASALIIRPFALGFNLPQARSRRTSRPNPVAGRHTNQPPGISDVPPRMRDRH